jgi:5-methylcytosine-specific restriction endonuclease McrA
MLLPYKDPQKQKEAARRWYERNRETHIQRTRNRMKANWDAHLAYVREYRRRHGRSDQPFISDAERLHNHKPLQRWLENPKLSPSVTELIKKAEQLFTKEEERRRLKIIYDREKTRRRKAKLKSVLVVQVSKKDLRKRFATFNDCCAYCGKLESFDTLHIDHFMPVAKGGTHVLGNLVPACKACNFSKRDHHPEEWYKKQIFFSDERWRLVLRVLDKNPKNIDQLSFL